MLLPVYIAQKPEPCMHVRSLELECSCIPAATSDACMMHAACRKILIAPNICESVAIQ